jgi:hypothetical protein
LSLKSVQQEWSDGELYWIFKNGLKMTGMPAFGATHGEEELRGSGLFENTSRLAARGIQGAVRRRPTFYGRRTSSPRNARKRSCSASELTLLTKSLASEKEPLSETQFSCDTKGHSS